MTRIGSPGKAKPVFNAWIAGSFQAVMPPLNILADVGPSRFSEVTPLTL